jgi:hypothetical protein
MGTVVKGESSVGVAKGHLALFRFRSASGFGSELFISVDVRHLALFRFRSASEFESELFITVGVRSGPGVLDRVAVI